MQPKPFKFVCPKCGYSKTVRPKSDTLNPMDLVSVCPKCDMPIEKTSLSATENLLGKLFGK